MGKEICEVHYKGK